MLEPSIRDGIWFPIPRDFTEELTREFWCAYSHDVFVGEDTNGEILWSYYTCPIQLGGGAHIANAGYAVSQKRFGHGLGSEMITHSLETARLNGYHAMVYTAVLSTNERAIRLYAKAGFETLARIPNAYLHPAVGYIDTLIMHRTL